MLKDIIKKYKSIGIVTSSLLITAIISFIALPFLSRTYTVKDFGVYGLALSIISVISTVSTLRLDQAILIADEHEKPSLVFTGFLLSVMISLITFVVLMFFKETYFSIAVAGGILANSVFQLSYSNSFSEHKEFKCGFLNIFRSLALIIPQLIIPLFFQHSTLIYGLYCQSTLIVIILVSSYFVKFKHSKIELYKALQYKDFIVINSPHALLNSFSHNMPYYFITFFLGSKAVGFYSIVERIMRLPINLMSQVIRQFFIRDFSNTTNKENDRKKALKASFAMSILSAPFFLCLIFIPENLYITVLGKQWLGIKDYFTILSWGYWAIFCNPPISAYIIAKRKSKWLLRFQIIELLIKCSLALIIYLILGQSIIILTSISLALISYNFLNILFVAKESKYA